MGIVTQEPVLFEGSVKENITYRCRSEEEYTVEDIDRVCKMANAYDFLMDKN